MTPETGPHRTCVVLVGPPGAGKSTIGRKLARELGAELVDTDAVIEAETGRTIPEIFSTDGEPEFRRIEEDVVRRAVLAERGIVSLGGGAILSAATRDLLRDRTVVYLEISVAEGLRRTGATTHRPLLAGADPGAKYRELMRTRRPLYREVASVRVRTEGRSPGRVVGNILARLGLEPVEREPVTPPNRPAGSSDGPPNRRSRRRRRGGRSGANKQAAATPTTVTEADGSGDPATPQPDSPAAPRKSRRSRRGGRRRSNSAATQERTTDQSDPTAAEAQRHSGPSDTATHNAGAGAAQQRSDSGTGHSAPHRPIARDTAAAQQHSAPGDLTTGMPEQRSAAGAPTTGRRRSATRAPGAAQRSALGDTATSQQHSVSGEPAVTAAQQHPAPGESADALQRSPRSARRRATRPDPVTAQQRTTSGRPTTAPPQQGSVPGDPSAAQQRSPWSRRSRSARRPAGPAAPSTDTAATGSDSQRRATSPANSEQTPNSSSPPATGSGSPSTGSNSAAQQDSGATPPSGRSRRGRRRAHNPRTSRESEQSA